MFCSNCGLSLDGSARFCPSCGTPTGPSSAPASPAGYGAAPGFQPLYGQPAYSQPAYSPPPVSPTALISPTGLPLPPFEQLAAALFHGLDQNVQPQRTGGLEVSKMTAYRSMGGATVPPYYGEQVLPTYASMIPIDLVPNQPHHAPVVSWRGWNQYLLQKISAEPEVAFRHLQQLCPALGLHIQLNRMDFPMVAFPNAVAKENMFKTKIYGMAQNAMAMGGFGGRVGMGSGVFGGGAGAGGHKPPGTGKLAAQVGLKILGASFGGGGGGFFSN